MLIHFAIKLMLKSRLKMLVRRTQSKKLIYLLINFVFCVLTYVLLKLNIKLFLIFIIILLKIKDLVL
jgi:hypothetical protein